MGNLIGYAAYVPHYRLERETLARSLGTETGAGSRSVAGYDEDTTSMGVEAARRALSAAPGRLALANLLFATAHPAYADKTNAAAIHAALDLPPEILAVDLCGSIRSGVAALLFALDAPRATAVVLADICTGRPGSSDESDGGDASAALIFGAESDGPALARVIARGSRTVELLDRWRPSAAESARIWEERFGEEVYAPLALDTLRGALDAAAIRPEQVDHLIVTGMHGRAVRRVRGASGVRKDACARDWIERIGNAGTAHVGLLVADVLDRARPDQTIAILTLADGADALVLRTTEAMARRTPLPTLEQHLSGGGQALSHATFLSWREQIEREPPRRPDPEPPYAPPAFRRRDWKFGFVAARCLKCGTRHLPPDRVCMRCGALDQMAPERMAEVPGTITTFTIDRLSYSPNPPLVSAVVDFDGGGRFRCQLTDVDPERVAVGDRVEPTFRRFTTSRGIHNYFWKARPLRAVARGGTA